MALSLRNLGGLVVPGRYRFHEPDEGRTFATLTALVDFVLEYRRANGIEVASREALQAEIEDWICSKIGSVEHYCLQDGKRMEPRDHTGAVSRGNGYQGQEKWGQLHRWALLGEGSEIPRRLWLEVFGQTLPCGECRREWRKLMREYPAPLEGSVYSLWKWTFERHNDVRRRLGQQPAGERDSYAELVPPPSPDAAYVGLWTEGGPTAAWQIPENPQ